MWFISTADYVENNNSKCKTLFSIWAWKIKCSHQSWHCSKAPGSWSELMVPKRHPICAFFIHRIWMVHEKINNNILRRSAEVTKDDWDIANSLHWEIPRQINSTWQFTSNKYTSTIHTICPAEPLFSLDGPSVCKLNETWRLESIGGDCFAWRRLLHLFAKLSRLHRRMGLALWRIKPKMTRTVYSWLNGDVSWEVTKRQSK